MELGKFQFSYVGETSSFDKASEKVEKRLIEQEKQLKKSEKGFTTLNKVLLASGVGLSVLAVKKIPKLNAGWKAGVKGTGKLIGSLEKMALASKGVFGPFAKIGTALTGLTIGFETASFGMTTFGLSTAGVTGSVLKFGTVLTGGAALALTSFISLAQSAADTLGSGLIARTKEFLEIGGRLETQTFALGLSLDNYRASTKDASVTTESMVNLIDDLARSTGLSRGALKGGLTQMLNLSRATGLTSDQIKILIERAADMSVAMGTDFNEAIIAIDQSFKGYNAQLLNFGVNITQGSLASTDFAKNQTRTVSAMSASQLATAKFEDILKQTTTTQGALKKSTVTMEGSLVNAELAQEAFNNRLGKATTEIFGPAITAYNNLTASIFDMIGKGGLATATASLTAIGGAFFTGIAFILKWGAGMVLAREVLKLLRFAIKNAGKAVGLFSGALQFLSAMLSAASVGLENLSKSTGKYAFLAGVAEKASRGLAVSAGGIGKLAGLAEEAGKKATSRLAGLTFGLKSFAKILWIGIKGLLSFGKILSVWGLAIAAAIAIVLALVGVFKSLAKTILGFMGIDAGSFFKGLKKDILGFKDIVKDLVKFMLTLPERITSSMELLTNFITVITLKAIRAVSGPADLFQERIDALNASSEAISARLSKIGKEPKKGKKDKNLGRVFPEDRELLKARKAADLARLDIFNRQESVARRISHLNTKISNTESDIFKIEKPAAALRVKLVNLEERRNKVEAFALSNTTLIAKGLTEELRLRRKVAELEEKRRAASQAVTDFAPDLLIAKAEFARITALQKKRAETGEKGNHFTEPRILKKSLADIAKAARLSSELDALNRQLKKLEDNKDERRALSGELDAEIFATKERIKLKSAPANDREKEEKKKADLELFAMQQERQALLEEQDTLEQGVSDAKKFTLEISRLQSEIDNSQNRSRFAALKIEKELLTLKQAQLQSDLIRASKKAGKEGLGAAELIKFQVLLVDSANESLGLIAKEKALRLSLINELGPLNAEFQAQRVVDLNNHLKDLRLAGATEKDITRAVLEAERTNRRAVLDERIQTSTSVLTILRAKAELFFEDTRTLAQKVSTLIFDLFESMGDGLVSTLTDIATGLTSLKDGFKDLGRAILDNILRAFIDLGLQQAKNFAAEKLGFAGVLGDLATEGVAVGTLIQQYNTLAVAKGNAAAAGGLASVGGLATAKTGSTVNIVPSLANTDTPSQKGSSKTGNVAAPRPSVAAGAFGAAGLGAAAGGVIGSTQGPEAAQQASLGGLLGAGVGFAAGTKIGAVGGPVGAAIGATIGITAGVISGRKARKSREAKLARLEAAEKFGKETLRLLQTDEIKIAEALQRITDKFNSISDKDAAKVLEDIKKDLEGQVKVIKKNLKELAQSLGQDIGILQLGVDSRDATQSIQDLNKSLASMRKEFESLPDTVPGYENLLNTFATESLKEMVRQSVKSVKDIGKAFTEGARKDSGELISITARSIIDIAKLNKSLVKLEKERAKAVKDIQNEGVAQRQKTIAKSKEERIKKINDAAKEEKLNLDNQISTIEIVTKEKEDQHKKDLAKAEEARRIAKLGLKAQNDKNAKAKKDLADAKAALPGLIKASKIRAAGLAGEAIRARQSFEVRSHQLKQGAGTLLPLNHRLVAAGFSGTTSVDTGFEPVAKMILSQLNNNESAIKDRIAQTTNADSLKTLKSLLDETIANRKNLEAQEKDRRTFLDIESGKTLASLQSPIIKQKALIASLTPVANGQLGGNKSNINVKTNPDGSISVTIGSGTQGSFATGGLVPETGPFQLHKGEFVLNAGATSQALADIVSFNKQSRTRQSSFRNKSFGGPIDLSVNLKVGNVDSPERVREIEKVVTRLQNKQLFKLRQTVSV